MQQFTRTDAAQVVRPRKADAHKGSNGRIVIVAGNTQFGGAAIMSATAAVYAGAGLVTVATDAQNHTALHARLPEAMVTTWDDSDLPLLLRSADVIVIGPGLGTDAAALGVLTLTLAAVADDATLIIDGSAIDLIASEHITVTHTQTVWTPHPVELQRLIGLATIMQTDTAVALVSRDLPGVLVAKGAPTRIFAHDHDYVNTSGGPAMATGGSGDTLTGVLAAFVGQFGYSTQSVAAGVWTHSAAADEIAQEQYVAVPSVVAKRVPFVMRELME